MGNRVLLVEDHEDSGEVLCKLLGAFGLKVQWARTGREAVERATAADETPDLVLLDLGLPDISGEEVARQIRSGGPSPPPPIVVLSGKARSSVDLPEAEAFLQKPVSVSELIDTIIHALASNTWH
jgi:CheY-like chemotaxis protein